MKNVVIIPLPHKKGDWIIKGDGFLEIEDIEIIGNYLRLIGKNRSVEDMLIKQREDKINKLIYDDINNFID